MLERELKRLGFVNYIERFPLYMGKENLLVEPISNITVSLKDNNKFTIVVGFFQSHEKLLEEYLNLFLKYQKHKSRIDLTEEALLHEKISNLEQRIIKLEKGEKNEKKEVKYKTMGFIQLFERS